MTAAPRDSRTHRPGRIVRTVIVYLIIAFVVTAVSELWFRRTWENNLHASLEWHYVGTPMTGVFTVIDGGGRPIAGAYVKGWNSSGFSAGVTDQSGVTSIHFGEPELIAIDVNDRRVLDRQGFFVNGLPVSKGLNVCIVLKP